MQLGQRGGQLGVDLLRRGHRHPARVASHRVAEQAGLPAVVPRPADQLVGERPHLLDVGHAQPRGQRVVGGNGHRDRLTPQTEERLAHGCGDEDAAFHLFTHFLLDRRGVRSFPTVAQAHPLSGYAKPVCDALQDQHVEHLTALEDLAHL